MPKPQRVTRHQGRLLVPDTLRRRFSQLKVYVDFSIPKRHLEEFEKLRRSLGDPSDLFGFAVTEKGDPEVGLAVHRLGRKETGNRFHAIIEFRQGGIAPYRRVSRTKLEALLCFVRERARRMHLELWQQVTEAPREAFVSRVPAMDSVTSGAKMEFAGHPATISGVDVALEPYGDKPAAGISLQWREDRVVLTAWTSGGPVKSLDDALRRGPTLLSGVVPSNAFASQAQPPAEQTKADGPA